MGLGLFIGFLGFRARRACFGLILSVVVWGLRFFV